MFQTIEFVGSKIRLINLSNECYIKMFTFAGNFGSRISGIKRESGEKIFKSRTVPATVSYNASCDTSSHCPYSGWEDTHEDASQETCHIQHQNDFRVKSL